MVDNTAPAVENGQLRRLVVTVQRLIVLVFKALTTAVPVATPRAGHVTAAIERDDEIVVGAVAIGCEHIWDLQLHRLHTDVVGYTPSGR